MAIWFHFNQRSARQEPVKDQKLVENAKFLILGRKEFAVDVQLMTEEPNSNKNRLHDLYPHWTEEQLKTADESLERYLEVGLRIYKRILADPEEYARFKTLTASARRRTIKSKRSNPSN